jgi:hypothetical protein
MYLHLKFRKFFKFTKFVAHKFRKFEKFTKFVGKGQGLKPSKRYCRLFNINHLKHFYL